MRLLTWLATREAANLLGLDESTLQKAAKKGKYDCHHADGKGRGGRVLQFSLESLKQAHPEKFTREESASLDEYTGAQLTAANYRAMAVREYQRRGLSPELFMQEFNAEHPEGETVTRAKLFNWQRRYQSGNLAELVDHRGGHNRGESTIPSDAWDCFYALYMTQQKRAIKMCYDITKMEYPGIPSVSAFETKVKQIPYYAILYYRDGPTAFRDQLPSMERSRLDIQSNDIWFSDHHKCDVFIKSEDGQSAVRPWLTVFFDARSNKVISFLVRIASPSATAVKQCLRTGIEQHGVPLELYFDNGKDYRVKRDFSTEYPASLAVQLGINMIYATPYHGQAKTVERFFGTFTNRFSKRFATYTGCNAKLRPECMQTSSKEIVKLAPTLADYIEKLAAYLQEYNNTPSKGRDLHGCCPNQVYAENLIVKRAVADFDALRLLCGNSDERVVNKNGILIKNNSYFNDILQKHIGQKVIVTFAPADIDKIAVFDMENRAICMAEAKICTPFRHTSEEDYRRTEKEKKAARAIVKQHAPVRELDIHSIIARNQAIFLWGGNA